MGIGRTILLAAAVQIGAAVLAHSADAPAQLIEKGRRIYEAGRLGSGEPLRADRGEQGIAASGKAAACSNCHQRSGFGLFEASNLVPPVTGPSLFDNARAGTTTTRRAKGSEHEEFAFLARPAYDDASLASALREGVSPSGHRFQYLMPRYALNEEDMAALIAYLHQLSREASPGIDATAAHFATVVAPGQDAGRRRAFIDVLSACFREHHPAGAGGQAWHLHVWELSGAAKSWQAQLEAKYAERPVFALISGLGGDEWEPVHEFAEAAKIPSLFANVDVAPSAEQDLYSFYFSKGVILEAEVLAQYLRETGKGSALTRVVQLLLADSAGVKAAARLRDALKGQAMSSEERVLEQATPAAIAANLQQLTSGDALVIWLERDQLAALADLPPPPAGQIVFSGWLGGFEQAPLPADWKRVSLMLYPVDAPQRRDARMQFNLRPWLRQQGIEAADEMLLGNTLAACKLLSESMARLRGNFFRDYLLELIQNYPSGMGNAPAPQAFPRFALGPGQRYSSKGAYIVRFKAPTTSELELVHDWLVPP
jgi:hypothetical protein